MKSLFKKIIVSFLILMMIPIGVGAEEYNYIGDSDRELYMRGRTMDLNIPYIAVNTIQAYCAEYTKAVPHDIRYIKREGGREYDITGVLAIIYNGYPSNISNLQEKYSLTDSEALMLTQYSLWNYMEGWDRADATEPYAVELLKKADNKEFDKNEFNIDETKLFYKEIDGFLETELIESHGGKGEFVIKTDEGTKAYDKTGRERYTYEAGESFMLRNVSRRKEDSTITIIGEGDVLDMDVYEPEDSRYQDLITAATNTNEFSNTYTVHADITKNKNVVQTGDNEALYVIVVMIGCVVYILLNIDLKKKCR